MRRFLPPALIVLLLFVQAWWSASTTSGTFDETTYLRLGAEIALHGNFQPSIDLGVAPLPVVIAGIGARVAGVVAPPIDENYRRLLSLARASTIVLISMPLALLVYVLLARVGGREVATVGAALVVLSPNMVAHMALATTDACFVLATLVVLLALVKYVNRRSIEAGILLGVALGLALAVEYTAVLLFGVATVVLLACRRSGESRATEARRAIVTLTWVSLLAAIVAWACHGFATTPVVTPQFVQEHVNRFGFVPMARQGLAMLQQLPLPAPIRGLSVQLNHARAGHDAFLFGRRSRTGWWYYMLAVVAMKSTPVEIVLLIAGACVLCTRGRGTPTYMRVCQVAFLVIAAAAFVTRIDLGVRYVLGLYPLAIFATLTYLRPRLALRPWRVGGCLLIAAQAWSALSIAPRYLSYVNVFVGGPVQAARYIADSNLDWGQDLPALKETLERVGAKRALVSYLGTAPLAAYGVNATMWHGGLRPDVFGADWIAISATHLDGLYLAGDPFAAFRALTPSARAGYSILLYSADRADVQQAIRHASRQQPG